MRYLKYITESYNRWTFPDTKTLKSDFAEYKKKEERKWKGRAEILGARWPLFDDFEHFVDELENAKIVTLTPQMDAQIMNRSHTRTIQDLKDLVGTYIRPRDVDRIVKGFEKGDKIPYPIVLKSGNKLWIMAGNTRLDSAFIMNIKPKVLVVNVS